MSSSRRSAERCGKPVLINSPTAATARATLILAHGAGAPMDSVFMEQISAAIADHAQVEVIRFEFNYMHQRRTGGVKRPPPKVDLLVHEWSQWLLQLKSTNHLPLFIGGKSMGGRIATLMNSDHEIALTWKGVMCLGYPFHPQKKPDVLRTSHLDASRAPVYIVQGTRDKLGNKEDVASYKLPPALTLEWIESADHDLKPLKISGSNHIEAIKQAAIAIAGWV